MNKAIDVNQYVRYFSLSNFWPAGFQSNGSTICGALSSGSPGACSVPMFANQMTSPVLTDAISPAPNQGAVSDLSSLLQHQYSAPGSMSLQMSQLVDPITDNEYGRNSFLNRHNINRSPIAVQALPATSQTTTPQQRYNSLTSYGSSVSS